ncbi:YceD family protein [Piscinibacter gummiphilus]|uniref:Large ribosomal RNA subunit accumulation protein YceD n=1 Tax=Piscinibacter gummiphilus TaxID=946333 RepID=A0ABZ0CWX8_9BURK|nr:YceD family protein [Piscinibacter gummiphilus]WOB09466.1 YceD family protein [Piscinibacter gummiphilus]
MKARDFDPSKLDVEALAKAGASLDGAWPVAELERLAASTVAGAVPGAVTWRAAGEHRVVRGGEPQVWLHLKADTQVMLECQRCLKPVAADVHAERSFLFVQGESAAAELDADSEDDVLALTRALDLRALVEDELLLELPLVPRHEVCPEPLQTANEEPPVLEEKPNPFAVLASLKRGSLPN